MSRQLLDLHFTVPAHAHELRKALRIVAIGLFDPHGKGRLCVAGINANDGDPRCTKFVSQPGRGGACLQTDFQGLWCTLFENAQNGYGIR